RPGGPSFGPRFQATFGGILDHAHVGKQRMITESLGSFQKDTLFNTGAERAGEDTLQRVACVDNETGVDIAPVGFEIRVHSGEGACHRLASWRAKRRQEPFRLSNDLKVPDIFSPAATAPLLGWSSGQYTTKRL